MNRIPILLGLAALVAAASAWSATGPIITRGSAALPSGCGPVELAAIAWQRGNASGQRLVYAVAVPNRRLGAKAELEAGLVGPDGASIAHAVIDCPSRAVVDWTEAAATVFASPGECPAPKGWSSDGLAVACAARPSAWETSDDFKTAKSTLGVATKCALPAAQARVVGLLRSFDYGKAGAVAGAFSSEATFQPYTASLARSIRGRAAIRAFVDRRVKQVDGWTATRLRGPLAQTRETASYSLSLVAFANGLPVGAGGVDVAIDCRSGLVTHWIGPALPLPS